MTAKPVVYRQAKQQFLTVAAFSQVFGVSPMTIYRLVHTGEVHALKVGRSFRIPVAEIKRFAEASLMNPDAERDAPASTPITPASAHPAPTPQRRTA